MVKRKDIILSLFPFISIMGVIIEHIILFLEDSKGIPERKVMSRIKWQA
jgi:hypothetical protein